ncbi:hypothetical protein PENSPDRAFT_13035 [Peniophora sp. CONT]|nr:hypothetical protein PENSPDRAFT_13035 [Peniophora sp. CONT]
MMHPRAHESVRRAVRRLHRAGHVDEQVCVMRGVCLGGLRRHRRSPYVQDVLLRWAMVFARRRAVWGVVNRREHARRHPHGVQPRVRSPIAQRGRRSRRLCASERQRYRTRLSSTCSTHRVRGGCTRHRPRDRAGSGVCRSCAGEDVVPLQCTYQHGRGRQSDGRKYVLSMQGGQMNWSTRSTSLSGISTQLVWYHSSHLHIRTIALAPAPQRRNTREKGWRLDTVVKLQIRTGRKRS